jgi:hypothetical protein
MSKLEIPLFYDYSYTLVNDLDRSTFTTVPKCFGNTEHLKINYLFVFISLVLIFVNFS